MKCVDCSFCIPYLTKRKYYCTVGGEIVDISNLQANVDEYCSFAKEKEKPDNQLYKHIAICYTLQKGGEYMKKVLKAVRVYEDDHNLMMQIVEKRQRMRKHYLGSYAEAYQEAVFLLDAQMRKDEKKEGK